MFNYKNDAEYVAIPDSLKLAQELTNNLIIAIALKWRENLLETSRTYIPTLDYNKLPLYSFYFATANGTSKELFYCVGDLYRSTFGPFAMMMDTLLDEIKKGNSDYFQIQDNELKVKTGQSIESIISKIENKTILGTITFKDLVVQKNDKSGYLSLKDALESSKSSLAIRTGYDFLTNSLTYFRQLERDYYQYDSVESGSKIERFENIQTNSLVLTELL